MKPLMIAVVFLLAPGAFAADDAKIEKGKEVYQRWCWPCHGGGERKPGTIALGIEYKGSKPAALEERTDLTAPVIKTFVRKGVYFMPSFRKTEITDAELDAMSAYLTRNNKTSAR